MSDNLEKNKSEPDANIDEAYNTLREWVKSAPETVDEIKKNGTKEDLKKYQSQIKMVIDKMKEIESVLRKNDQ
tara:strand:- start:1181 stop:1399 length:219 start_codon:yes stop_codon:yes gene_type:complete